VSNPKLLIDGATVVVIEGEPASEAEQAQLCRTIQTLKAAGVAYARVFIEGGRITVEPTVTSYAPNTEGARVERAYATALTSRRRASP
jgi:hypothetical protein